MYDNFNAERVRRRLDLKDLAPVIDTTESTLSLKLRGKSELTLIEAKQLMDKLNEVKPLDPPYDSIETLFDKGVAV